MPAPHIAAHVKPYRGSNTLKQVQFQEKMRAARELEAYIRKMLAPGEVTVFTYGDLAEANGLSKDFVRELLMPVGGGHNGITLRGPGKDNT